MKIIYSVFFVFSFNLICSLNTYEYECVIVNEDGCKNEYLYAVDTNKLNTYFRRMVFTFSYYYTLHNLNFCSILSEPNETLNRALIEFNSQNEEKLWVFIQVKNKNNTFFIRNFHFNEYLYAAEDLISDFFEKESHVFTWKGKFDKQNEIFMWKLSHFVRDKYIIKNVKRNTTLIAGEDFFYLKNLNQYQRNVYASRNKLSKSHWDIKCKFDEKLPTFFY